VQFPDFIPGCRIICVSLDDLDADDFRGIRREALDQFSSRKVDEADWSSFSAILTTSGDVVRRCALKERSRRLAFVGRREPYRLHYLRCRPVPPCAVPAAGRSRVSSSISASSWKSPRHRSGQRGQFAERQLHDVFRRRGRSSGSTPSLQEAAHNILAFSASPTAGSSLSGSEIQSPMCGRSMWPETLASANVPASMSARRGFATWW